MALGSRIVVCLVGADPLTRAGIEAQLRDRADIVFTTRSAPEGGVTLVVADQVDPLYLGKSYYLAADGGPGARPYVLLRDALEGAEVYALVKVALRSREAIALIRPGDIVEIDIPNRKLDLAISPEDRDAERHLEEVAIQLHDWPELLASDRRRAAREKDPMERASLLIEIELEGPTVRGRVALHLPELAIRAVALGASEHRGPPGPVLAEARLDFSPRIPCGSVWASEIGRLAGAGVVLAPGALADASRWIDWWWADHGAGLGQLDVDLDPESAEFYDYPTTEWYREPARTGQPCVAGPYVDYICTHKYTFTLSVPVPVTDGTAFLGVAGADILADEVERMVLPALSGLGGGAVLANGNGRGIASTTAALMPGVVLRPGQPGGMCHVNAPGSLPWRLYRPAPDERAATG